MEEISPQAMLATTITTNIQLPIFNLPKTMILVCIYTIMRIPMVATLCYYITFFNIPMCIFIIHQLLSRPRHITFIIPLGTSLGTQYCSRYIHYIKTYMFDQITETINKLARIMKVITFHST